MKVWPKNDDMRKLLRHPTGGAFSVDSSIPAEWPDDSFTHRLIQDGDVVMEAPAASPAPADVKAKKEK
jgi:hypothetical protein